MLTFGADFFSFHEKNEFRIEVLACHGALCWEVVALLRGLLPASCIASLQSRCVNEGIASRFVPRGRNDWLHWNDSNESGGAAARFLPHHPPTKPSLRGRSPRHEGSSEATSLTAPAQSMRNSEARGVALKQPPSNDKCFIKILYF